jgi:hypothetical protein
MRTLAIVVLLSTSAVADRLEGRLGMMAQGRYKEQPYAGFELGAEYRRDRFAMGFTVVYGINREDIDDQMGPLQHIVTAGPTASWLFASEDPANPFSAALRGGLDLAFATTANMQSEWAIVPRVAIESRAGESDGAFVFAFGYGYAIGGDAYRLGGFDTRIGFARYF